MRTLAASAILGASLLVGCADNARLPATAGVGPAPALPPPTESAIPTIAVAPAQGWAEDEAPTPASGLRVTAFARGLDHPRWLHVLPDGDVLVAESNAQPSRPKSLRDVVMKLTAPAPKFRAPTASCCCATRTVTASPRPEPSSCPG